MLTALQVRKIFPKYKDRPNEREKETLERIDEKIQEQAENGEHTYKYYYDEVHGRLDIICNSLKQRGFSLTYNNDYITILKVIISW